MKKFKISKFFLKKKKITNQNFQFLEKIQDFQILKKKNFKNFNSFEKFKFSTKKKNQSIKVFNSLKKIQDFYIFQKKKNQNFQFHEKIQDFQIFQKKKKNEIFKKGLGTKGVGLILLRLL